MKNFKLCFLAGFAFLVSSTLFAQVNTFGVEAGTGFASIEYTNGDILGQINGLSAGAFYSMKLNSDFSIQPEILYVEKGGQTLDQTDKFYVNYLEVPVLVKWYLIKTILNPAIFAGPFYAANVSSAVRGGVLTNINVSDYGGTVGLEISMNNTFLSMRWDISVGDICSDSDQKNRDFILMIGQGF
jgi:hypothetical protein